MFDKKKTRRLLSVDGVLFILFDILKLTIGYVVAFIICALITLFLIPSCNRVSEDVSNIHTEFQKQEDSTHTTLDVYDYVDINTSWQYGSWFMQDSFLAHVKIIDFDTLGRPTRQIDADIHRGTATTANSTVSTKDTTHTIALHIDSIKAGTNVEETIIVNREITRKLPWWQRTSFHLIVAALAAIIAAIIAYLTRNKWYNRLLTWLHHIK